MMFITEIYGNGMFLSGREGGAHGQLQPWPDCFLSLTPVTGTLKWNVPSSHCRASGSPHRKEEGKEGGCATLALSKTTALSVPFL